MVVRKVPSVPVITSVSVSTQSEGGDAELHFKTGNSDLCEVKLFGQNNFTSKAWDPGTSCSYQERLLSFSLPTRPCQDHSVSVRCRNSLHLDKVITQTFNPQHLTIQPHYLRSLNTGSLNNSNTSTCPRR